MRTISGTTLGIVSVAMTFATAAAAGLHAPTGVWVAMLCLAGVLLVLAVLQHWREGKVLPLPVPRALRERRAADGAEEAQFGLQDAHRELRFLGAWNPPGQVLPALAPWRRATGRYLAEVYGTSVVKLFDAVGEADVRPDEALEAVRKLMRDLIGQAWRREIAPLCSYRWTRYWRRWRRRKVAHSWDWARRQLRMRLAVFEDTAQPPARLRETLDDCRGLGLKITRDENVDSELRGVWIGNWIRECCGVLIDARMADDAEALWPEEDRDGPKDASALVCVQERLSQHIAALDRQQS